MNVITYEDLCEYCAANPYKKEDLIAMTKKCVFRNRSSQKGTYVMHFRDGDEILARNHMWTQLSVLLARIGVGMLVETNLLDAVNWRNVTFESLT
jgi:hypothetical protein